MSGLSDHLNTINMEKLKIKEVGMETGDKSENDIQNAEDVREDWQDANAGDSGDSLVSDEFEVAADNFEMTETEASVLEGSNQISQAQATEDGVGRSQQISQAQTTEGSDGGTQQSEMTEGAVGRSQQSETADGVVGGSQQSEMTEGAVGRSQQSETADGVVGGSQQQSQAQMKEGAVGASFEPRSLMSEGAVGGRQQHSQAAASVFQPLLPKYLQRPNEPSEEILQSKFINMVTSYEGAPVAPSEDFELQWTVYQDELDGYLTSGLLPQDTVASAGIDEESYKQMQQCAEVLQDQLFDGNLPLCLGNLRGFRRIFSRSKSPYLCHAFRGNPLEVLQNIYYGGDGILPEDRMQLSDPFHFTKNPDDLDN